MIKNKSDRLNGGLFENKGGSFHGVLNISNFLSTMPEIILEKAVESFPYRFKASLRGA